MRNGPVFNKSAHHTQDGCGLVSSMCSDKIGNSGMASFYTDAATKVIQDRISQLHSRTIQCLISTRSVDTSAQYKAPQSY